MIANVMAIQRGVQFGVDCGLNPNMIESDEATVVKWINLGLFRDSDFGTILSDIDVLRTTFSGMRFCHIPTQVALSLAKYVLCSTDDRFWMEDYPACIRSIIVAEKPG
ncbi:hypothetical protein LWI29_038159 [Acer saccharum]|uniref:RNase H type-1 domain-containing protein n=1 Tax=Acer saccharum TaxID=4024 RepID=A0AA39RWL2_ACESA|nr:hypothetical protein LWI29_038159 [Acer saccharum]